jgi:hypothetical protein
MTELKMLTQSKKIKYILAYADKRALKFFMKQGYQEEITINKFLYLNYIEHFDGAKLM